MPRQQQPVSNDVHVGALISTALWWWWWHSSGSASQLATHTHTYTHALCKGQQRAYVYVWCEGCLCACMHGVRACGVCTCGGVICRLHSAREAWEGVIVEGGRTGGGREGFSGASDVVSYALGLAS